MIKDYAAVKTALTEENIDTSFNLGAVNVSDQMHDEYFGSPYSSNATGYSEDRMATYASLLYNEFVDTVERKKIINTPMSGHFVHCKERSYFNT